MQPRPRSGSAGPRSGAADGRVTKDLGRCDPSCHLGGRAGTGPAGRHPDTICRAFRHYCTFVAGAGRTETARAGSRHGDVRVLRPGAGHPQQFGEYPALPRGIPGRGAVVGLPRLRRQARPRNDPPARPPPTSELHALERGYTAMVRVAVGRHRRPQEARPPSSWRFARRSDPVAGKSPYPGIPQAGATDISPAAR